MAEADKVEFLSPAYCQMLTTNMEQLLHRFSDRLDGISFSVCEVFEDIPPHINEMTRVIWRFRLERGNVTFGIGDQVEPADLFADMRVIVKADVALAMAQVDTGGSMSSCAELERLVSQAKAEGNLRTEGDSSVCAEFYSQFHDMNTARTL